MHFCLYTALGHRMIRNFVILVVLAELVQSNSLHVAEHRWRVLNVLANGVQTGGVTKIARSVIAPLAEHNVSVLMLSTYQTDFILVRLDQWRHLPAAASPKYDCFKYRVCDLMR